MMRLLVDTLIVCMLLGTLAGILIYQRSQRSELLRIEAVQQAMRAIESESLYRAALGEAEATPRGYARHLRRNWFEHQPQNLFLDADAHNGPWVEHINMDSERELANPRHIVASTEHPPFWYNPYRGVVRARVPMQMSQRSTVDLYNAINGTYVRVDQVEWPRSRWAPGVAVDDAAATLAPSASDDPILQSLRNSTAPRTQ